MSKYIFFDIDGTIYDSYSGLTEDAVYTIKALKEKGNKVFICTGRSRSGIDDYIVNLGFDGIVAACGLYIEIDGKVIKNVHIPKETLEWIINRIAKNKNISVILEGSDNVYIDLHKQTEDEKKKYSKFIENNKKRIRDINTDILNINKFGFRIIEDIENDSLLSEIADKDFDIFLHSTKTYEVVPNGYDKSRGMMEVLDYFGASIEDSVAVGDSINDVPMLKKASIAIVPANGSDIAKKEADILTDDIMNFGLKKAFIKLGMIDE